MACWLVFGMKNVCKYGRLMKPVNFRALCKYSFHFLSSTALSPSLFISFLLCLSFGARLPCVSRWVCMCMLACVCVLVDFGFVVFWGRSFVRCLPSAPQSRLLDGFVALLVFFSTFFFLFISTVFSLSHFVRLALFAWCRCCHSTLFRNSCISIYRHLSVEILNIKITQPEFSKIRRFDIAFGLNDFFPQFSTR